MTARIDREAVAAELLDLLDKIDAAEERAREAQKVAKERIAKLRGQAQERRDVLSGRVGVQIPLTAAVLDEAREVKARKDPARCRSCDRPASRPGGALTAGEELCWECHDATRPEQAGPTVKVHRSRKKKGHQEETTEEANERRRGAAKAVGVHVYESRDPDDPAGAIFMRCVECDEMAGGGHPTCPNKAAHTVEGAE